MTSGAVLLADYPGDVVAIACAECGRAGRYGKARLVARFGADARLPDVLRELAGDCPRAGARIGNQGCGAVFPELTPAPPAA